MLIFTGSVDLRAMVVNYQLFFYIYSFFNLCFSSLLDLDDSHISIFKTVSSVDVIFDCIR